MIRHGVTENRFCKHRTLRKTKLKTIPHQRETNSMMQTMHTVLMRTAIICKRCIIIRAASLVEYYHISCHRLNPCKIILVSQTYLHKILIKGPHNHHRTLNSYRIQNQKFQSTNTSSNSLHHRLMLMMIQIRPLKTIGYNNNLCCQRPPLREAFLTIPF